VCLYVCDQETPKGRPKVRPGLQAPVNEMCRYNLQQKVNYFISGYFLTLIQAKYHCGG
jgi:hypothetical protein